MREVLDAPNVMKMIKDTKAAQEVRMAERNQIGLTFRIVSTVQSFSFSFIKIEKERKKKRFEIVSNLICSRTSIVLSHVVLAIV